MNHLTLLDFQAVPEPETTTTSATSDNAITNSDLTENERMKYELEAVSAEVASEDTTMVTEIRPLSKSETARALDELGFKYNEYMDDSDFLGDESNDEVIPPFREENYEHDEIVPQETSYFMARAIPSKSGALFEGINRVLDGADIATSRQAPLPHHYEPSTIVGITVGAFLLIFIGTGE